MVMDLKCRYSLWKFTDDVLLSVHDHPPFPASSTTGKPDRNVLTSSSLTLSKALSRGNAGTVDEYARNALRSNHEHVQDAKAPIA
jgi:hypothetical protein